MNDMRLVKKRLMFSVAEDSYFLTYNIILILGLLQCINDTYLKDSNKIALLVTIIEKPQNIKVVKKIIRDTELNENDKNVLFDMYYNSKLRMRSVLSIIFSLNKKGIINVRKNRKTIDISLTNKNIFFNFNNNKIFENDVKTYQDIFSSINKIRNIVSDTLNSKIFKGIKEEVWDI